MTARLAPLFVALLLAVTACNGDGDDAGQPTATPRAGLYLALGDSVAAGNGASDAERTGYVALLAADIGAAETMNLAEAGATTQVVIDEQLREALGAADGQDVSLITISAGGNDLAALIPNATCVEDPTPPSCPLDEAMTGVADRTRTIVSGLREAYPDAPIVLLAYPNFFSGTGHPFEAPAARVLPQLGETLREVAGEYPRVAVAAPDFNGRGDELTHVLDPTFDPHPNDAGHRVIADAHVAALRELEAP